MKVLVGAASKHGATLEIAEEIGRVLREALHERGVGNDVAVDVCPAEQVSSVEDYDAVVLGSAVYAGHWLEPARDLAERHAGRWPPDRSGCSPAGRSASPPSPPKRNRWT